MLEEEDLGYAVEWDRWAALTAGLAICAVNQEPYPGQEVWIDVGKLATRLGLEEVTLIAMWRTLSLNAIAMLTPNVKGRHKRKDPLFLQMAEFHESGLRALQTWDREVSVPLSLYRPYINDSIGQLKGINYRDAFRNSRYGQETREDLLKLLHESREIAQLRILQVIIAHSFDAPYITWRLESEQLIDERTADFLGSNREHREGSDDLPEGGPIGFVGRREAVPARFYGLAED